MSDEAIEEAYAFLRGHTTGDLQFEEHLRPIKYVIAPDGRLVAPVMVAMLHTFDTVLFVPEVGDDALQLQLTLEPFDEQGPDGAFADRWRIHHGDPPDVNWAFAAIDAARHQELVIDGTALTRENPLRADEPRICRHMNQEHRDDLRNLCVHYASIRVEDPVMVAIDPLGIDVRGLFDVIRVPATRPFADAEAAREVLETMAAEARAAVAAAPGDTGDTGDTGVVREPDGADGG